LIELLSKKIADFIIAQNVDEADNRDVLIYGNTLVISDLVSIIVILIIGLIFDRLICSIIFFLSFAIMREQSGGYHARTHIGCNLVLGINTALVMTAVRFFGNNLRVAWGLLIISAALGLTSFMLFAPREHENKKLEQYSKDALKKRSIIVWLIVSVVQIVLLLCGHTEYAVSVGLSMVSVSIALLV